MQVIDEKLAELVGVLLGDGSINTSVSGNLLWTRVQVTFHSEQKEYIEYVRSLMEEVLGVNPIYKKRRAQNCADLQIFRFAVLRDLLLIGMQLSPKWDRARIPLMFMNKYFGRFVLRGYFDTDGSVVIANNNGTRYPRLEMKISPSPMQEQLLMLLDLHGFHYGVYDIGKGKVRVQMNGFSALKRWNEEIGFSNSYYQERCDSFYT
ncbi:hypothetical protein JXA12_01005 [Candidatus Woesearchaeota archaeon]|nr:hypothetical protein [Candidatus Woesearchaeota archaeon]